MLSDYVVTNPAETYYNSSNVAASSVQPEPHGSNYLFEQQNYYFLFDKQMSFSKRKGFSLHKDLSTNEYLEMQKFNREHLCQFLEAIKQNKGRIQEEKIESSAGSSSSQSNLTMGDDTSDLSLTINENLAKKFPVKQRKSFIKLDPNEDPVKDEEIDLNFKRLLSNRRNGKFLNNETVAHLEYFMNTLNMEHKTKTENPFENPYRYPAFLYKGAPEESSEGTSDDQMSDIDGILDDESMASIIDSEDEDLVEANKNPLELEKQNLSAKNMNNLKLVSAKFSIQSEIRRKSIALLNSMTMLDKHRMLIHPNCQGEQVRKVVMKDKQSILQSQDSKSPSKHGSLIDNSKIQQKIVDKSIRKLGLTKDSFYPNMHRTHKSQLFSGSPQPKTISGMNFNSGAKQLAIKRCSMFIQPMSNNIDHSALIDDSELKKHNPTEYQQSKFMMDKFSVSNIKQSNQYSDNSSVVKDCKYLGDVSKTQNGPGEVIVEMVDEDMVDENESDICSV